MGTDISVSNHLVQVILDGEMPGFQNLYIPIVDVRDVAAAHILAMTTRGALRASASCSRADRRFP